MGKLPQNVADAVKSFDEWLDFIFAEYSGHEPAWQTIRAHLLSQDAEIEHKEQEWNEMFDRALVAESSIAAADALLRKFAAAVRDTAFKMPPPNQWTPVFVALALEAEHQTHLQRSGDEAGS